MGAPIPRKPAMTASLPAFLAFFGVTLLSIATAVLAVLADE